MVADVAGFNRLERDISLALGGYPGLKSNLKRAYQAANFAIFGETGFEYSLHEGARLFTPWQRIGEQAPPQDVSEFFGYFDISPWSRNEQYYLVHRVKSESDQAEIIVYDFATNRRNPIASTQTWTWQQGAMARWVMFAGSEFVAFNTVRNGELGTQLISPDRSTERFVPFPLQAENAHFGKIYAVNYRRLFANGSPYGYSSACKNFEADLPPGEDGIWSVNLDGSAPSLIVALSQLMQCEQRGVSATMSEEVNHISVSPDGRHFVFVHRYRDRGRQFSRLYLARHDGSSLRLLLDDGVVSHYAWLTSHVLVAWVRKTAKHERYVLIEVPSGQCRPIKTDRASRWGDGHPTFSSAFGLVATDSYPDRKRQQQLFLFDPEMPEVFELGRFFLPVGFHGRARIDLHPRWSPTGRFISIDSGFTGARRNYILDVSGSLAQWRTLFGKPAAAG